MDYAAARFNMVEGQVRTNKVIDAAVISALREVPRERFVPADLRGVAYVDEDLKVAPGRYVMEPMVTARLLQAAAVRPTDRVLDVGCGTGYELALLAKLAQQVVGLDSDPALVAQARATLQELGAANVTVVEGDLAQGLPAQAPFDVIFFSGAVSEPSPALRAQLADGGRMVKVLKRQFGLGQAMLTVRTKDAYSSRVLFDAATPVLPGFAPKESFVF